MLCILGSIEIIAGVHSVKIGGPREHVVLAALALRVRRVVSFDQLMEAVWHHAPPQTARSQIQSSISVLRKLFGEIGLRGAIRTHPAGYLLDLSPENLDSEQFTAMVATARRQVAEGQTVEAEATLDAATRLWRGPAADGVQSEAVRRAATALDNARMIAIEEHLRLRLELGRHKELVSELQDLLADHPLRESLYGYLMLALYRSGCQAEALAVWWRARRVLLEELGIEPHQGLRDLERAILNSDPSLDLPVRGSVALPVDPEPDGPRQLPASIADFVGRHSQLAEIKRILLDAQEGRAARYAVPIIAISGRSGVGKSTLACRAAQELAEHYPDGHLYVDMRSLADENDGESALLTRFLCALGVPASAVPEEHDERIKLYRSRLAAKRVLVVLDNVEGKDQVVPLLPGSPTCAVLMTSTARSVRIPGAHWIDVDTFDDETSTELLARIVGRPQWRIVELTRRLKTEVRRLDELSHHGLEVRSSIARTYRRLPKQAQRLLRLLALVDTPDFPSWLAAVLLQSGLPAAEDALDRLVDVQLLDTRVGFGRSPQYRFHNLVRVYSREMLAEAETAQDRDAALRRMRGARRSLAERVDHFVSLGDFGVLHGSAGRVLRADQDTAAMLSDPSG